MGFIYNGHICLADDTLFTLDYGDLPEEWQRIIENQRGLGCDGGGTPGPWCGACHWNGGEQDETEVL